MGTTVSIEPRQQKAGVTVNGKNITGNYTLKHLVSVLKLIPIVKQHTFD